MTKNQQEFVNMLDKRFPILNQIANVIQYGKSYDPYITRATRALPDVLPHYNSTTTVESQHTGIRRNPDVMLYNYMPGAYGY